MTKTVRYIGAATPFFDAVTGAKWEPGRATDVSDAIATLLLATGQFDVYDDRRLPLVFGADGRLVGARLQDGSVAGFSGGNGSGQRIRLKSLNGGTITITGDTAEHALMSPIAIPDGFFTDPRNEMRVEIGANCNNSAGSKKWELRMGQSLATAVAVGSYTYTTGTGGGRIMSYSADPNVPTRIRRTLGNTIAHFGATTSAQATLSNEFPMDPTQVGLNLYIVGSLTVGTDQLTLESLMVDATYGMS